MISEEIKLIVLLQYSMEYPHCGIVARLLVVSLIAVCCSGESDTSTQLLFINYY